MQTNERKWLPWDIALNFICLLSSVIIGLCSQFLSKKYTSILKPLFQIMICLAAAMTPSTTGPTEWISSWCCAETVGHGKIPTPYGGIIEIRSVCFQVYYNAKLLGKNQGASCEDLSCLDLDPLWAYLSTYWNVCPAVISFSSFLVVC